MWFSGSEVAAAYKGRRPGRRFHLHPLNPLGRGLSRFAPKVGGGGLMAVVLNWVQWWGLSVVVLK